MQAYGSEWWVASKHTDAPIGAFLLHTHSPTRSQVSAVGRRDIGIGGENVCLRIGESYRRDPTPDWEWVC